MIRDKVRAAYDLLAESYDRLIDHKPHNAYYDRPNTLRLIGEVDQKKVLDAACGPGKYAEILAKEGAKVTGFDISPEMVRLAKRRNHASGHFFVHDLSLPFPELKDSSFDIVICALALHYIPDWNPALKEFFRVLKPGGILVLSFEHPFFEYTYFDSKKYFEIEAVEVVWSGFGPKVAMHSFRRPLQECINPIIRNGFNIEEILEPLPSEEFKELDPKHYIELSEFPAFMHIKAIKN